MICAERKNGYRKRRNQKFERPLKMVYYISMRKNMMLKALALLSVFSLVGLSSCGTKAGGFDYEYGWGAVEIKITGMRFTAERNVKRETEGEITTIPWGRYFQYDVSYHNISYYWQELPKHHYYFKTRPSTRDPDNIKSIYRDNMISMTFTDDKVLFDETVTGSYKILYTTDQEAKLEGTMSMFVVENEKLGLIFSITVSVDNWVITLVDGTKKIPN